MSSDFETKWAALNARHKRWTLIATFLPALAASAIALYGAVYITRLERQLAECRASHVECKTALGECATRVDFREWQLEQKIKPLPCCSPKDAP